MHPTGSNRTILFNLGGQSFLLALYIERFPGNLGQGEVTE